MLKKLWVSFEHIKDEMFEKEVKMPFQIPSKWDKLHKEELDKEIIRAGTNAESDAINLYEQLSTLTTNEHIRKILLDLARDAKAHAEVLKTLLLECDSEQREEKIKENKILETKLKWNMY
ncbi:MAG TPA: ferritin family protein [bacterium]